MAVPTKPPNSHELGLQLMGEAERKHQEGKGFLGFANSSKLKEAIELYIRAANQFKKSKQWVLAGEAFDSAAKCYSKIGLKHDAAFYFHEAAVCYKKEDHREAAKCFEKAIEVYVAIGKDNLAAKCHIAVAELYEHELCDADKAIENYETAANHYSNLMQTTQSSKCMLKVASYAAECGQYFKAIEIYEETAMARIESSLLKYSATEYFFRAALCHLCVDTLNGHLAIARYSDAFPFYTDSRENKLIKQLINCIQRQDEERFQKVINDYDRITKFDRWFTLIFLRIKEKMVDDQDNYSINIK